LFPLQEPFDVTAFPPRELPCFIGTMQSSDSLNPIYLPCLVIACRIYQFPGGIRVTRVATYSNRMTCQILRLRGADRDSPYRVCQFCNLRV